MILAADEGLAGPDVVRRCPAHGHRRVLISAAFPPVSLYVYFVLSYVCRAHYTLHRYTPLWSTRGPSPDNPTLIMANVVEDSTQK